MQLVTNLGIDYCSHQSLARNVMFPGQISNVTANILVIYSNKAKQGSFQVAVTSMDLICHQVRVK